MEITTNVLQVEINGQTRRVTVTTQPRVVEVHVGQRGLPGPPGPPAAQVNADWNATEGVAEILNKPDTDGIAEGATNLYYTDVRVDTRVQAGNYTITGNWVFDNDINMSGGWRIGRGPGGEASNVAIGIGTLASRTTATNNIAIGNQAINSNQAQSSLIGIGAQALYSYTSGGAGQIAIGRLAATSTTQMSRSTIIGDFAGRYTTIADGNTLVGYIAGTNCQASGITGVGANVLAALVGTGSTASNNTALGHRTLQYKTDGQGCVGLGHLAGAANATDADYTGAYCTYLGAQSSCGPVALSVATAVGALAKVTTNNTVVLGRTTDNTVIGATGDDGSGAKLQVTGAIKSTSEYRVGANKVTGARETGWSALTGTAKKGGGATYTAPSISNPPTQAEVQAVADALQDAHRTIKALTDALITHGLIGA